MTNAIPRSIHRLPKALIFLAVAAAALLISTAAFSIDLVNLSSVGGPLQGVFTILGGLTPGVKALAAFIGFLAAAFGLMAARNFAPVLFYVGLTIFLAVGLLVAGSILSATI